MTERDKHIEMAQRLGLVGMRPHLDGIYIDVIAAFAKIVADDARATPALPQGDAVHLAREFHETYERLAPQYGYKTRESTKVFDAASPNGQLMIAVCREIQARSQALPQGDLYAIPDTHRLVPVALLKSSAQETVNPFIRAKLQAIIEDKP